MSIWFIKMFIFVSKTPLVDDPLENVKVKYLPVRALSLALLSILFLFLFYILFNLFNL